MILGIGTDLIEIDRIEKALRKFPQRFKQRVFTTQEQVYAEKSHYPAARYAKRFTAKEAFLKALGTGLSQGISWHDIEVLNNAQGQPELRIHGQALAVLQARCGNQAFKCHLSLTDTASFAQAFVVINIEISGR
jgi:holo-[acyl-carrier protein] synthase